MAVPCSLSCHPLTRFSNPGGSKTSLQGYSWISHLPVRPECCQKTCLALCFRLCTWWLVSAPQHFGEKGSPQGAHEQSQCLGEKMKTDTPKYYCNTSKTYHLLCVRGQEIVWGPLEYTALSVEPKQEACQSDLEVGLLLTFVGSYQFHWDKFHAVPLIYLSSWGAPVVLDIYLWPHFFPYLPRLTHNKLPKKIWTNINGIFLLHNLLFIKAYIKRRNSIILR